MRKGLVLLSVCIGFFCSFALMLILLLISEALFHPVGANEVSAAMAGKYIVHAEDIHGSGVYLVRDGSNGDYVAYI